MGENISTSIFWWIGSIQHGFLPLSAAQAVLLAGFARIFALRSIGAGVGRAAAKEQPMRTIDSVRVSVADPFPRFSSVRRVETMVYRSARPLEL